MTNEVAGSPGLFPVLQVMDVVVAPETGQLTPSMTIEIFEISVTKPVPVKVTTVPPTTVPNRGLIAFRSGVRDPLYYTELKAIAVSPFMTSSAEQSYDVAELSITSVPVNVTSLILQAPEAFSKLANL
jgi:hypothetical protein